MTEIKCEIISSELITPEDKKLFDQISDLAFRDDEKDPELRSVEWSPQMDWMGLGRLGEELVTILGLLKREILVGKRTILVYGIGGVATHPNWQKQGFSSALLNKAAQFMLENKEATFGLLICAEERRSFYGLAGWKYVADALFYFQSGNKRKLKSVVMVLPILEQNWPQGEIDLCGLPW